MINGVSGAIRAAVRTELWHLARPFRVSHMTTSVVDLVRLDLIDDGGVVLGYGDVSADPGYEQDGPTIAAEAYRLANALIDEKVGAVTDLLSAMRRLGPACSGPARALTEMALLDAAARSEGCAPWQLLKLPPPPRIQLLHTVPIGEQHLTDRRPLKVKMGGEADEQVLAELIGSPGPILLDVNGGWSPQIWRRLRPTLIRLAPAVLEDPTLDPEVISEIRDALPGTAIVLDEPIDSQAAVDRAMEIAGGANVKVMRMGGILETLEALRRLTAGGHTRMIGSFLEPSRSVAYAAQLAGMADWTDLDGHFWISSDPQVMSYELDSSCPGIPAISYDAM